ncbi:hypothetical protein ACFLZ4_00710 [Patescibacteria group bacterium]
MEDIKNYDQKTFDLSRETSENISENTQEKGEPNMQVVWEDLPVTRSNEKEIRIDVNPAIWKEIFFAAKDENGKYLSGEETFLKLYPKRTTRAEDEQEGIKLMEKYVNALKLMEENGIEGSSAIFDVRTETWRKTKQVYLKPKKKRGKEWDSYSGHIMTALDDKERFKGDETPEEE